MRCPDCNHDQTSIVDSRKLEGGDAIRRRRECNQCEFRYTTYERKNWNRIRVKKEDGRTEPYNEQKVKRGIELAVEKRPITPQKVSEIADDVTSEMESKSNQIVESDTIGSAIAQRLKKIDKVAYVRFVSVYKGYSNPEEFREVLDSVVTDTTATDESAQSDSTSDSKNTEQ